MSILRAGTWVGDVAEVMDALGLVSDDQASRIAPMLGMELIAGRAAPPAPGAERAAGQPAARPPRAATRPASGSGDRLRSFSPLTLPPLEPIDVQPPYEPPAEPDAPVLAEENPDVTASSRPRYGPGDLDQESTNAAPWPSWREAARYGSSPGGPCSACTGASRCWSTRARPWSLTAVTSSTW